MTLEIFERGSEVFVRLDDGGREVAVKAVWARPLSGRGGEVSLLDARKAEVAMVDFNVLDTDSRRILVRHLQDRYVIPKVARVLSLHTQLGVLLWEVDTDFGRRRFTTKDPSAHVIRIGEDGLIIRDTSGNSYEICSLGGLDRVSRLKILAFI